MNDNGGYLIWVYLVYGVVSVGLVVWLARTLFHHGQVFLEGVFETERMASAVNHLLVVGFYLLNLGYAFVILQSNPTDDAVGAVEVLVRKLGILLLSLGAIHFGNLYVFHRIRRRTQAAELPPPVAPQAWYQQGAPVPGTAA